MNAPTMEEDKVMEATELRAMAVRDADLQVSGQDNEHEVSYEELKLFLKNGPYSDIEAGVYSDFKVKCRDKIFNLHRAVVLPQSPYLTQLITNPSKYRPKPYDKKERQINLGGEDPNIFALLVQLMYLRGLDPEKNAHDCLTALDYVQLYIMTDGFLDETAQNLALNLAKSRTAKLCSNFRADSFADLSNWELFTEIVEDIYNYDHRENSLKAHLVHHAVLNWRYLKASAADKKEFLSGVPDFAAEVLAQLS